MKQKKHNNRAALVPMAQRSRMVSLVAGLVLVVLADVPGGVLLAQPRPATPIDSPLQPRVAATSNGFTSRLLSTNTPVTNAVNPAPVVSRRIAGDYLEVGFDQLGAFPVRVIYETMDPATLAYAPKILGTIPPTILALDGKKVAVHGFLLPLKQADGLTTEFLLLKDQSMCCFGLSPKVNEWILVQMTGKGVPAKKDELVILCGTLHVGEFKHSQQMAGVYRVAGDKLLKPVPTP